MSADEVQDTRTIREALLNDALRIVHGTREEEYGTPMNNFKLIADLWTNYLRMPIIPADVAAMMVLLKVARLSNDPTSRDGWLDIAGYAACGAEVAPK